jgi:hypothetical protein
MDAEPRIGCSRCVEPTWSELPAALLPFLAPVASVHWWRFVPTRCGEAAFTPQDSLFPSCLDHNTNDVEG